MRGPDPYQTLLMERTLETLQRIEAKQEVRPTRPCNVFIYEADDTYSCRTCARANEKSNPSATCQLRNVPNSEGH